jgi:S1-C subfamily serine protease
MKSRLFGTAVVGLTGAIIGSFSMMLFASTHFGTVAGPNNEPPAVSAAPLSVSGGSDQERIVNAVKRVQPSVVAIDLTVNGRQYVPPNPFDVFNGGSGAPQYRKFQGTASGSGFIYSRNGLIVTNAHVAAPKLQNGLAVSKMEVVFKNGDKRPAHLVSANVAADLALIKVDGYDKLPAPLEIADSAKLNAGQWAIAIGEPLELLQSVTLGVVSGFNRDEPISDEAGGVIDFKGLLQTSAPINPGNSGGPLVDEEGRVIGVNQSTAANAPGIGFAIPSNTMREVVAKLTTQTGVQQGTNTGFIGAQLSPLDDSIRAQLNYIGQGAVVIQATPDGPAAKAGLKRGDVIQTYNGQIVSGIDSLIGKIKATKPGETATLGVWSAGTKKEISLKIGERPAADPSLQQQPQQGPGGP